LYNLTQLNLNVQLLGWIKLQKDIEIKFWLHVLTFWIFFLFVGWWTIIASMVIFLMCHQHFKFWTYPTIILMEVFQHIIPQHVHYLWNICKCFEFSSLQDLKCLFIAMNLFYFKESVVGSSFNQKNWKLKRTTIYVALINYSYSVYIHHTHHEIKSYRVQVQLILTRFTHRQNLKHYIKHLLDIAIWKAIFILIVNLNPSKSYFFLFSRGKLMVFWTCPTSK
jgi:hypothetical protein